MSSQSSVKSTPGQRFRDAVAAEQPLQVVGAINANHALLAQRAGFKAIYLSGGGVAAGSLGLPDLGITGLQNGIMDVNDLGELESKPAFRTRLEWLVGLAVMHGRAAARVWGINNADFMA